MKKRVESNRRERTKDKFKPISDVNEQAKEGSIPIDIDARSSYGIMLCARCEMNEFVCVSISISNSRIYSSEILASARNGQTNKPTQSAHASASDVIVVKPACACELGFAKKRNAGIRLPIEKEAKTFRMMENRETCFPMQMDPFHAAVSCKIHNRFLLLVCHFCCFIVMFVYISADCELLENFFSAIEWMYR